MADSYLDLGTETVKWLVHPNWKNSIKFDILYQRFVHMYPGTVLDLYSLNDYIPLTFEYGYLNMDKATEYALLAFFISRQGRLKRFWIPLWKNYFRLTVNVSLGANTLTIADVDFRTTRVGYERIFIELADGSMITRQITNCVKSGNNEVLTLASAIDRNILITDIMTFGRFLLCRLDTDGMSLEFMNDSVSEVSLKFIELVKEYSLL